MYKKFENNKGITLIALIVTIIILLILAGVAIASLSGENGLFANVKLTNQKYAISEAKEKLELKITELRIEKEGKGENLTKEDLIKLNNDEIDVGSTESFPVEVICGKYKFNIDEKFIVTYVGEAEGITIVTYATEPEGYVKEGTILIKIKISNSTGISKIQNPTGLENNCNGKTSISIDYPVTANGTYTFKIIDVNGNETIKDIIIDRYDTDPVIVESQQIDASTSYKLKIKAKDELSGLKRITVTATITNDSNTESTIQKSVTLSGEYQKEELINIGLKYNYTLTAYTIEVEDQAGNIETYNSTVTLPIKNDIYSITTEDELRNFASIINGTKDNFTGKTVYLENDIELTQEWTTIGNIYNFEGTFEGNNHIISGLTKNLFKYNYGTIQNLYVNINTTLTYGEIGAIVNCNKGTITNCHSSGTIEINTLYNYIGGIAGHNEKNITNCSNKVNIIGNNKARYVGGIAGDNTRNYIKLL